MLESCNRNLMAWPSHLGELVEASHHSSCHAALFEACVSIVASALGADMVTILESRSDNTDFILRDGHGFPEDLYHRAQVPSGLGSQAGRAMLDSQARVVELADFSGPHDWTDEAACAQFALLVGTAIDQAVPRPDLAEARGALSEARAYAQGYADSRPADDFNLTDRESDVLLGLAADERLNRIATSLCLSDSTVSARAPTLPPLRGQRRVVFDACSLNHTLFDVSPTTSDDLRVSR